MPIYEYECSSCSNVFEKLESINSESKESACPKCGKMAQRKISLTAYHLTGHGFHNTDYKNQPKAECPSAGQGSCCSGCPSAGK